MDKLKQKIAEKLREKLGMEFGGTMIMNALGEKSIEKEIKMLVKEDKVKIID